MKVFIVYWHAEPQSFNGALFQTAQETLTAIGHDVRTSDLYDMRFDPVSDRRNFTSVKDATYFNQQMEELHASAVGGFAADVEAEMQKLEWGELMLWQFPLWWFGLPAVFKGWVDRVFAMGRTYSGDRRFETGVFRGKQAMLSVTTGGPVEVYRRGVYGEIMDVLRPMHRVLWFAGFDVLAPHVVYGPGLQIGDRRQEVLEAYRQRLQRLHVEHPIEMGES